MSKSYCLQISRLFFLNLILVGLVSISLYACKHRSSSQAKTLKKVGKGKEAHVVGEVRVFEGGGRKIIFIDMVHIAPQEYYDAVKTIINEIYNDDSNAVIMAERVWCSDTLVSVSDLPFFLLALNPIVLYLKDNPSLLQCFPTPDEIKSSEKVQELVAFLRENGATYTRPSGRAGIMRELTEDGCYRAHLDGLQCQKNEELFPNDALSLYADIDMTTLNREEKWAMTLLLLYTHLKAREDTVSKEVKKAILYLLTPVEVEVTEDDGSKTTELKDSVISVLAKKAILTRRENRILDVIEVLLARESVNTIILPWGAAHMEKKGSFYKQVVKRFKTSWQKEFTKHLFYHECAYEKESISNLIRAVCKPK